MFKKIFKYIEPLWTGPDGKLSINRCLAMLFAWKVVTNADYIIRKWEQGRSAGDASTILLTLAGLIPVLLGITAWSNMTSKKIESDAENPQAASQNITVQKAENVTSGDTKTTVAKVETVNAEKVDTVNTNTINIKETNSKTQEPFIGEHT